MPRFFVKGKPSGEYWIGGEDGRHITRSLRMKPGERLTLCDGEGYDYLCTLLHCGEEGALVTVEESRKTASEPETRVTVCQCLPKSDKLETVVQKAVELGAWEIQPVESSRCVVKLDGRTAEKKSGPSAEDSAGSGQTERKGDCPPSAAAGSAAQGVGARRPGGRASFFL